MVVFHFPAIPATTIAEIELFLSQRSLESGFHTIAAIAELFFCSDDMETRL